MHRLYFLSRVAFVCNLFFVLCLALQWKLFITNAGLVSTTLILGYFVAPLVVNPLVNIGYALVLMRGQPLKAIVPHWLVYTNFGFLIIQFVFALVFIL